jgi:hypothetical protein
LAVHDGGGGRLRLLAVIRRAVAWRARSHAQIWVIATAGYLACVIVFPLVGGWPRQGVLAFAGMMAPWAGAGIGQSYDLVRRRNAGV